MRTTHSTQERVFNFIKGYSVVNREAPTIMEIGKHFEMSVGGVHFVLKTLERDGVIKRSRRWRGIEIVEHPINAS